MLTLASLTAHKPAHRFDPYLASGNPVTKSLISSFLPNFRGQGPIGSAIRIISKLHQYTFRQLSSSLGRDDVGTNSRKKDEEQTSKAIKVVDLLEHSAELGNMDAVFTLAQIYLVRSSSPLFS